MALQLNEDFSSDFAATAGETVTLDVVSSDATFVSGHYAEMQLRPTADGSIRFIVSPGNKLLMLILESASHSYWNIVERDNPTSLQSGVANDVVFVVCFRIRGL
jgi:hypothetical protein